MLYSQDQISTCKICGQVGFENSHVWKTHKIKQSDYYTKYFPKFNLLTNKPIVFKDKDNYFGSDFDSRAEMGEWIKNRDKEEVKKYLVSYLIRRRETKGIKKMIGQFESRSLVFPAISFIIKKYGINFYNDIVAGAGLENSYDYEGKIEFGNEYEFIFCDSREQAVLKFPNMQIVKINVGDYAPNNNPNNIFVDRKSLPDSISTFGVNNLERFERELVRTKESGAYLIMMIEEKFDKLIGYRNLPYISKKIKSSPEHTLHQMRGLVDKYRDCFSICCVNGRDEMKRVMEKIFKISSDVRNLDFQFLLDCGKL